MEPQSSLGHPNQKSFVAKPRFGKRGNVLILAGLLMPAMIGVAGLAVDTIMWTLDKRQLQRSADSAALAGGFAKAQSHDSVASALMDIQRTNKLILQDQPIIETPPSIGSYSGKDTAVRVVLRTSRPMTFSSLFLDSAPLIEVASTAAIISNGNFCVISLDDSNAVGVEVTGSAIVDLNCGIFANSGGASAVSVGGASSVKSTPVAAVGGVPASSRYASPTTLMPFSLKQPDPFSQLPVPELSNCRPKISVQPNRQEVISPGCYKGIDIKGSAQFEPGTYYVDGSEVSFGSQASAVGNGVTFVLGSSEAATDPSKIATLNINGGATLDLKAPETGMFKGVLFYQDPRSVSGTTNRINGNSLSKIEGAFYFPKQNLDFNGNSGLTTDCVQFVAYRVTFSGNSAIQNSCPLGEEATFRGAIVRIVE